MKKISISRWLTLFVLFAFLFNACSTSTQSPNAVEVAATQTYAPTETVTPEPTATNTNTPTATLEATAPATAAATESSPFGTLIDVNRVLETCPVLTDAEIPAYNDWVIGEIQKDGAYVPFGPNAKLIPPVPQGSKEKDYFGVLYTTILWDSTILKGIKPEDLPFRHLDKYIACYKYLNYTKLILPNLWLKSNDRSKPSLLLSSFNFEYGYGKKYTDFDLRLLITNWKTHGPFYYVPPVATGGDYAQETDLLKLSIDANNQFPDIATGIDNLENTGDASGLSRKRVFIYK